MYKGLLKNYSIQLADKINQKEDKKEKIFNNIFENLEKYTTTVLPIKIELGIEPVYKEAIEDYEKFNSFLAGKLDKRDVIEKRMILLGLSRKLFTHSLPLAVAEMCYEKLIQDTRELIVNSPNRKKQEMAYQTLILLIEEYNLKVLSTKIYWERPQEKEEYKQFWDKYQEILKSKQEVYEKKQILFLKNELKTKKIFNMSKLIKYYQSKLYDMGEIRKLKNTYSKHSNVKLIKKKVKEDID